MYEQFAQSSAQVGVGSTAIYEGPAFGLKTFVYDCPGPEVLQALVEDGAAQLISSPEEMAATLEKADGSFDRE
mgnify:CR=1 FL=1